MFWTYRGVLSWEKSDNLALELIILKLWGGLHLVGAIFGVAQTSSGKTWSLLSKYDFYWEKSKKELFDPVMLTILSQFNLKLFHCS